MKLLPRDDEAEKAILSAWMRDPIGVSVKCSAAGMSAEWFCDQFRIDLFTAMQRLLSENKPCIRPNIVAEMRRASAWVDESSPAIFGDILAACPIPSAAIHFLDLLREKAAQRALIATCDRIGKEAWSTSDIGALLASAAKEVSSASSIGVFQRAKTMAENVDDYMRMLIAADGKDEDVLKTGLTALDRHSPLRRGDMPLIAGERKAGKSIFSLSLALRIAEDHPVVYFSLEDRIPKLMKRVVANASRVPTIVHRNPNDAAEMQLAAGCSRLKKMNFVIHDDVFEIHAIVALIRQAKAENPDLALAVIDYGQLVRGARLKGDSRETEVAMVSRTFRLLAMETHVTIMLLSQLNKDGDARESKALEQDATAMWKVCVVEDEPGVREIQIPFQRDGEGNIAFRVAFLGDRALVETFFE